MEANTVEHVSVQKGDLYATLDDAMAVYYASMSSDHIAEELVRKFFSSCSPGVQFVRPSLLFWKP